jgi:hypothetical protein
MFLQNFAIFNGGPIAIMRVELAVVGTVSWVLKLVYSTAEDVSLYQIFPDKLTLANNMTLSAIVIATRIASPSVNEMWLQLSEGFVGLFSDSVGTSLSLSLMTSIGYMQTFVGLPLLLAYGSTHVEVVRIGSISYLLWLFFYGYQYILP